MIISRITFYTRTGLLMLCLLGILPVRAQQPEPKWDWVELRPDQILMEIDLMAPLVLVPNESIPQDVSYFQVRKGKSECYPRARDVVPGGLQCYLWRRQPKGINSTSRKKGFTKGVRYRLYIAPMKNPSYARKTVFFWLATEKTGISAGALTCDGPHATEREIETSPDFTYALFKKITGNRFRILKAE